MAQPENPFDEAVVVAANNNGHLNIKWKFWDLNDSSSVGALNKNGCGDGVR